MATYTELLGLAEDNVLRNRIRVAVWVACDAIRAEPATTDNNASRLRWARDALANPEVAGEQLLRIALAQHRALTVDQIRGATDEALQTAVNAAINVLARG